MSGNKVLGLGTIKSTRGKFQSLSDEGRLKNSPGREASFAYTVDICEMELAQNSNYVEIVVGKYSVELFAITATQAGHVPFSVGNPH